MNFQAFLNKLQLAALASIHVFYFPRNVFRFAAIFFLFVVMLQWFFQPSVFWDIITNSALSLADKLDVIIDGFFAVFQLIDDFTPISFILIALLQSLSIIMWLELRTIAKNQNKQQLVSIGLGLVGSGCVACGGSILSPLLGAVASSVSVGAAQAVGDVVLFLAIVISFRAWIKTGLEYSHALRITQK